MRTWPEGRELADDECVQTSCAACGIRWRIHDRLSGFRLKCSCDEWLEVPGTPKQGQQIAADPSPPEAPAQPRPAAERVVEPVREPVGEPVAEPVVEPDETGLLHVPEDKGEVIYTPMSPEAPLDTLSWPKMISSATRPPMATARFACILSRW